MHGFWKRCWVLLRDYILSKLLDIIVVGGCGVLTGFAWLLDWAIWERIAQVSLILGGGYLIFLGKRKNDVRVEEANASAARAIEEAKARVDDCLKEIDSMRLRGWAHGVNPNNPPSFPNKVAIRFVDSLLQQEADAVADVFRVNGWNVLAPVPFFPKMWEFSGQHTVRVEFPQIAPWTRAADLGGALERFTGHKVDTVDASLLGTDQELAAAGVLLRVTVYGSKPT